MKRSLDKKVIENLLKSDLWQKNIKKDCEEQNVFFTIRDNRIDLYHKGGLLFTYNGKEFKTHIKYAAVIDPDDDSLQNYLSESKLKDLKLTANFNKSYDRIKENCSKYSGVEAAGVSALYHKHSYFSDSNIIVLDIEVSFVSGENNKKKDRIDLVLLDKNTGALHFVEAKHFSNKELWSTKQPAVIKQIKKYESQIETRREHIISEYGEYVRSINSIFGLSLMVPKEIADRVTLFIFGFDDDQKKGRLSTLITNNHKWFSGIKSYQKGDVRNVKTLALWNGKII